MKVCLIRSAQTEDYESIERIMRQVHTLHVELRPDVYAPLEPAISFEEFQAAVDSQTLCIADMDGSCVGLVWFRFRNVGGEGRVSRIILFIETLAVDEAHRQCGVGRALLDHVRTLAQEAQCDGVELQVNARNDSARAFYAQCGFSEKSINLELL